MPTIDINFGSKTGIEIRRIPKPIMFAEINEYVCIKDFDEIREGESIWAGEHPDKIAMVAMFIYENRFGTSLPIGLNLFDEHFEREYPTPIQAIIHSASAMRYETKRLSEKRWFNNRVKK